MKETLKCLRRQKRSDFLRVDSFQNAGGLNSNKNSNGRNGNGVDKKGDDSGTFGKIGLDKDLNILLNGFVPG